MAEDYALTSMSEVRKLQKELEELKKNPLGSTASGKGFMESLDNVSGSLENMMELFREASEQMKLEEREEQILAKKIGPILDKLDAIEDQNKKIAQGIVAVADMVEEMSSKMESPKPKLSMPEPTPIGPISPPPSMPGEEESELSFGGPTAPPAPAPLRSRPSQGLPPLQPPEMPSPPEGMPPLSSKPKKKGFLDMFAK